MLKLILHHTYKLGGQAADLSRNGNHGFRSAVGFSADGRAPGSGALQFAEVRSQDHFLQIPRESR